MDTIVCPNCEYAMEPNFHEDIIVSFICSSCGMEVPTANTLLANVYKDDDDVYTNVIRHEVDDREFFYCHINGIEAYTRLYPVNELDSHDIFSLPWRYNFYFEPLKVVVEELYYDSKLKDYLPSGSGFDDHWEYSSSSEDEFLLETNYHKLSDEGYYIGWVPIKANVSKRPDGIFDIDFTIEDEYIKDYAEEVIYLALIEIYTKLVGGRYVEQYISKLQGTNAG